MEFHTFPKPAERTLKVVIRGLPNDVTEEELGEELNSLGFDVSYVRQFIKDGRKLPLHMITLNNSPVSKAIFNLHSIFYISVKIEPYRSTNPAQCHKCQRFGHSSSYCGYTPRCVKCAGEHLTNECAKLKEEIPKCINCLGPHAASYKHCPEFLKSKAAKLALNPLNKLSQIQPQPHSVNKPPNHFHTQPQTAIKAQTQPPQTQVLANSTKTYANALSSNAPSHHNAEATIQILTKLLTDLSSGAANIQDVLITIITSILPLLIRRNE